MSNKVCPPNCKECALEKIKLEAWEDIKQYISLDFEKLGRKDNACLLNEFSMIEKDLKAIEIMKNKRVNLEFLKCFDTYERYCAMCLDYYGLDYGKEITEEEFKLLKMSLS